MNRLDRRKLLTTGAAAAVLASAGLPLAAQPKKGGLLRAVLSGSMGTVPWDARLQRGVFGLSAMQGAVFDCLTEVAPDGSLRGELAESWASDPAATIWDFRLRSGVEFHNGKRFEPRDVLASLAFCRAASPARAILDQIHRIDLPGRGRIRFVLTHGNPDFPYQLADGHLVIYPHDDIPGAMRQGIGTGLYRVLATGPDRFEGRRVKTHYKDGRAGWFDEVSIVADADTDRRAQALRDRRVDVADGVALETVEGMRVSHIGAEEGQRPGLAKGLAPFGGYVMTAHARLAQPSPMGNLWPVDNARLAERWWMA